MEQNNYQYVRKELPALFGKAGYAFFVVGLLAAIIAMLTDPSRAAFSSLLIFVYLMGLGMCSLFLVGLEYITDAVWSVAYRRISEFISPLIFIAPVFAIPVLFNMHDVFHWTHDEAVAADKMLQGKTAYLNFPFFIIRFIGIALIMSIFYFFMIRNSARQDVDHDQKYTRINVRLAGAFIPFFGITLTILAVDWIMSIEPHWFSTIFGVYYFSGSLLSAFAVLTLIAVYLKEKNILPEFLSSDHFYNLGAFMFAFLNFWAYIAFSQFLLIWYANIPEETFWYIAKFNGSWQYISIGLIFIHFIIPYAGLVSQPSKSNIKRLKFMSICILFAHLYDLYWLVMTTYDKEGFFFGWIELGFILLGIGTVMLMFKFVYNRRNIIPVGDPKLGRCIDFHI